MKNSYDVIIIGTGPAGLCCAIELQKSDKSILIIERNKTIGPKVCAGGLTTKVKGLGSFLNKSDKFFNSIKMSFVDKKISLFDKKPFVSTISREKLGKISSDKLSKKVDVVLGKSVDRINSDSIQIGKKKIAYNYLVGADGSNSRVRKHLGLKNKKFMVAIQYKISKKFKELELFFDANLFGTGYAWIFPHKKFTSVGCCCDIRNSKSKKLNRNFQKWLKINNIDTKNQKLEVSTINFDYQGVEFDNIYLSGDAAGLASGLTGEGIYFAMVSGQEIARRIINKNYQTKKLNEILKIKNKHERILDLAQILFSIHPSLLNLLYKILPIFFKSKSFSRKAIKLFS